MSTTALKKIRKSRRTDATELEIQAAQALYDLEQESKNLKAALTGFTINSAREIEVSATKTAVVVFYPLRYVRKVHKVQKALVATLEKKMHKNVLFVAQRKIERQIVTAKKMSVRSRTMKAVHEAVLDDICYPSEICGKRTRQLTDGSKHTKIYLEAKDQEKINSKIDTFAAAYNKLTGRTITFGFMSNAALQQVTA